jgi:hypothetical protein
MDIQINGQRGNVIYQEAVNGGFGPIHSTAARVSAIMAEGMPIWRKKVFFEIPLI